MKKILIFCLFLTACTAKTVYVPTDCAKAPMLTPPHNYLRELAVNSGPPEFVKACLSTSISGLQAYSDCSRVLKAYQ